jgi:vitamin B12 transporter
LACIGLMILFAGQWRIVAQSNDTLKEHLHSINRAISNESHLDIFRLHSDSTIQRYASQGLGKLLAVEHGIYIKSYGQGGIATLSIRGASASQTNVLWNDLPINSLTLGQQDLSLVPLAFSNAVHIQNGTSHNSGIAGGVHLYNALPIEGANYSFTKEIGSFDTRSTSFVGSYKKGKWAGTSAVLRQASTNDFDFVAYHLVDKPMQKRENASLYSVGGAQSIHYNHQKIQVYNHTQWISINREIPSAIGVLSNEPSQYDESLKSVIGVKMNSKNAQHKIQMGLVKDQLQYTERLSAIYSSVNTSQWSGQYFLNNVVISPKWRMNSLVQGLFVRALSTGLVERKQQNRGLIQVDLKHVKYSQNITIHFRQEFIEHQFSPFLPAVSYHNKIGQKKKLSIDAAIQTNYRIPSLNDLYWVPGGNPQLLPEKAILGEIGASKALNKMK